MEKTDVAGIYRSENGLVNTNTEALKAYKKKKETHRAMKQQQERMDKLEDELGDIKSLLQKLVEDKDKG